jgi:peptide/nickel transport system ATP-binding protein
MVKQDSQLLKIDDLVLHFKVGKTGVVRAVDGVNINLGFKEAVVVLGESGCGKTSLAKAILRLLPKNIEKYSGKVILNGVDTMAMDDETYRKDIRWVKMSMVPQAAMNSLNPVMKVGEQVAEPVVVHSGASKEDALKQARKMFAHVGVPDQFIDRYAFELSGGMRQRSAIAMALVTAPDLIILDEPTSALDVLTQANIFNVLKHIKNEMETSFILITHDIATSSELADKVAVMYAGQIVEVSDAERFFHEPLHPYAKKLMASVPKMRATVEPDFIVGQPPSLLDPPTGCRFAERCPRRFDLCKDEPPVEVKDGRTVKCWLYV